MFLKANALLLPLMMVALGIVVMPFGASADSLLKQAPEQDQAISRCITLKNDGELPVNDVRELPRDEDARVFFIQGHRGKKYVAFILGEGERAACETIEITKPVSKTRGTFWPNKKAQEVQFIRGKICTKVDGCSSMLVFKEKRGPVIAAVRRDGCPEGDKLETESMFGGREHSLRIRCAARVGPNEVEHIDSIMHIIEGKAQVLGSFLLGSSRTTEEPAGKGKVKRCVYDAPGWVHVSIRGRIPMLRVFQSMETLKQADEMLGAPPAVSGQVKEAATAAKDKKMGRQAIWKYDKDLGTFVEWVEKRTSRSYVSYPKCKAVKKK